MKTTNPEQFFDGRMLDMARAIQSNDMARLRQLAVGQNLNQPGRQDMSLLWFAIQPGQLNTEAVKTLVSLGADPAANPIKDFVHSTSIISRIKQVFYLRLSQD